MGRSSGRGLGIGDGGGDEETKKTKRDEERRRETKRDEETKRCKLISMRARGYVLLTYVFGTEEPMGARPVGSGRTRSAAAALRWAKGSRATGERGGVRAGGERGAPRMGTPSVG